MAAASWQACLPVYQGSLQEMPGKGAEIPEFRSDSAMRSRADQSVQAAASIPFPRSGFGKPIARFVQICPKSGPRCTRVPERPLFGHGWADIAVGLSERNARRHAPCLAPPTLWHSLPYARSTEHKSFLDVPSWRMFIFNAGVPMLNSGKGDDRQNPSPTTTPEEPLSSTAARIGCISR